MPSQTDVGRERLAERNALRAQHRLRGHSRPPATRASGSEARYKSGGEVVVEDPDPVRRLDGATGTWSPPAELVLQSGAWHVFPIEVFRGHPE